MAETSETNVCCSGCGGKRIWDSSAQASQSIADRDSAIASAARREERARLLQVREDIIRQVAQLVRIPTAPVGHNEAELVDREHVVTIAMQLKNLADKLLESEAT